MNRKQIWLTILVSLALCTVVGVYAGTVGVNDLFGFTNGYGFTDLNSTNVNAGTEFYRGGFNYTQFIASRYGSDQSLNTTDTVTFASVTTGEYYLNAVNITQNLVSNVGDTAYVGFDLTRDHQINYWSVDGIADQVQINAAITYTSTLGGGSIFIERGIYQLTASILALENTTIYGTGRGTLLNVTGNFRGINVNNEDNVLIENLYIRGTGVGGSQDGITIDGSNTVIIRSIWVETVGHDGILALGGSENVIITGCHVTESGDDGINTNGSFDITIFGCISEENVKDGLHVSGGSQRVTIGECVSRRNTEYGLTIVSSQYCSISGNILDSNIKTGLFVNAGHNNTITNNISFNNTQWGMLLDTASSFNTINENVFSSSINFDGLLIQNGGDDNIATNNIARDNGRWGIRIGTADCNGNSIKNNHFSGNTNGRFSDLGTDTRLNAVVLSFVNGTTFLSTAPFGWEIDANTEYAVAIGSLPDEVQETVRWKIYATSVILEADSMRLEIEGYGGASNEPYTTETVSVANHSSDTTNFAANDVVFWTIDLDDDPDLDDLVGGDQIMIKVLHEAAGGDDAETDAVFTCIIIEVV